MWREFIERAEKREESFAALCARFGVSRKTGYKWLNRFRAQGADGLHPQSRRPRSSPRKTPEAVVDAIVNLRRERPDWSANRIHRVLTARGVAAPAPSTIDLILRRRRAAASARREEPVVPGQVCDPNFRWVYRIGPEVTLADGATIVPASLSDEATGFVLGCTLLAGDREASARVFMEALLRRHGRPWRLQLPRDAGARKLPVAHVHSPLSVWLMRWGIAVEFAFGAEGPGEGGGSAEAEALAARLARLPEYQRAGWADRAEETDLLSQFAAAAGRMTMDPALEYLETQRDAHNFRGPRDGSQRRCPLSLFRPSPRVMPRELPAPARSPGADLRTVSDSGIFTFQQCPVHVGRAFAGCDVEIRPTRDPEQVLVLFAGQVLGRVLPAEPTHAPLSVTRIVGPLE